ncbi:MAG: glycosyltransferase family 4 protein [Chlamydiae bacterium]|nr:glycosyltransferase family 4 protein [Chlamydiota bacterium]
MKISIISRKNQDIKWGGDLRTFETIKLGLQELGHEAEILSTSTDLHNTDFVFLSNTSLDLRPDNNVLDLLGIPYGLIPFHENYIQYHSPSKGFFEFVKKCYNETLDSTVKYEIDYLFENPNVINYFEIPPRKCSLINYNTIKNARVCIANSPTEARTLLRDCPKATVETVLWTPGFADEFTSEPTNEFLDLTGLKSKSYILQVGRFETRKNQLASILATKDLDIPLVFISTKTNALDYEMFCIQSIVKWRKAPTIFIGLNANPCKEGPLQIIPMPNNQKLSNSMLQSAFFHAGLHLHPAFQELPGYTYFESVAQGTATIASSWTTIQDYFSNPNIDGIIEYCNPGNLQEIRDLVEKKFGQSFSSSSVHPIFKRTKKEMAQEFVNIINKYKN